MNRTENASAIILNSSVGRKCRVVAGYRNRYAKRIKENIKEKI